MHKCASLTLSVFPTQTRINLALFFIWTASCTQAARNRAICERDHETAHSFFAIDLPYYSALMIPTARFSL